MKYIAKKVSEEIGLIYNHMKKQFEEKECNKLKLISSNEQYS